MANRVRRRQWRMDHLGRSRSINKCILKSLILVQEWREGLRTALHPWIFAVVYRITDAVSTLEGATRTARAQDLLIAPKIVQAMFAASMDFYTWKLGQKVYGTDSAAAMAVVRIPFSEAYKCRLTNITDSLRWQLSVRGSGIRLHGRSPIRLRLI